MEKKLSYSEKLKNPKWQKKRLEIMKRDKFKCKLCGDDETTLSVHHLEYSENPWDIDNSKLITLCEHCHTEVELLKKTEEDFNFYDVKIYKMNDWTDRSLVICISYKIHFSIRIYNSKGNFIDGYNFNYYDQIGIRNLINKTLKYEGGKDGL